MTEERWRYMFARRLQKYLDEFNMSQSELAKRIFLTKATVNHYLTGRATPSITSVVNIAMVFGCDVADLIDFGENID